jgi:outer membrane protein TolC
VIRQLNSLQDQIVMGGETLYMALVAMERQEDSLQRQLESLNRTVEEMELRYQLGQISSLQLSQVKTGRASLISGLNTLQMNIQTYKMQLESMLGAALTGEIRLSDVPSVTDKELEAMDVEKDLLKAKARSYQLYTSAKDLEEANEKYKDEADKYNYNEEKTLYRKAKHTWQAAQHTYNDAIRGFELKFRTLHAQVLDYKQILDSTKVSLESEKLEFAAAELKQSQGTISQNAYLTAKDDLQAAEDAVQKAAEDLFSAYNTYCWAVEHGILN